MHRQAELFWTGGNPPQGGVTPSAIDAERVAVIRGFVGARYTTPSVTPLPGVSIRILGHPEYGETTSDADGLFSFVVSGGGVLTLSYSKAGYIPAQRNVLTPWRDYVWAPDVVLIAYDTPAMSIDVSGNSQSAQVVQGNAITDSHGTRQPTLFIPAGTTATVIDANGTPSTPSTLNLCASEFTVGSSGVDAMPAELPATSAYTYAVDLSACDAGLAQPSQVSFSQAVIVYVDNFRGFPTGGSVPSGYLDYERGIWVCSESGSGTVIELLGASGGLAEVDTDGDGLADSGLDAEERALLAATYDPAQNPGQTLWRVPLEHFTPWDFNMSQIPPAGAAAPGAKVRRDKRSTHCTGETAETDERRQVHKENVPIVGTPYRLAYDSAMVFGRRAERHLQIDLGTLPATHPQRMDVEIQVAGQRIRDQLLPPFPALYDGFTWDGRDALGRLLRGPQRVRVRLGNVYAGVDASYQQVEEFGALGGSNAIGTFGTRSDVTLWQELTHTLEFRDQYAEGLGGWDFDVHHHPMESLPSTIDTKVIRTTRGIASDADGSIYVADMDSHRVVRISRLGITTLVAGSGSPGFSGDGGLATNAQLKAPRDVAVGIDGSVYISDSENDRIRQVRPDGVIVTIAGTGTRASTGDGGLAANASINFPLGIEASPDGSVYVVENGQTGPTIQGRIRRISPCGTIDTVVGGKTPAQDPVGTDNVKATNTSLALPQDVSLGLDGSLYFGDTQRNRVRRVSPDGIITTVAGMNAGGFAGDGGPATAARMKAPTGVVIDRDGTLYIADSQNHRVRRVTSDGIITTYAAKGSDATSGDGGPALLAEMETPYSVAVIPNGELYVADIDADRIRVVYPGSGLFYRGNYYQSSEDGSTVDAFSHDGRHLRTVDALTGGTRISFTYSDGLITKVTDGDGNETTVVRNSTTNEPEAIIGPYGQTTTLELDTNGYLKKITNPASESHSFVYDADGLLLTMQDPNSQNTAQSYTHDYDLLGRLEFETDPAGGSNDLMRSEANIDTFAVTNETAMSRVTEHSSIRQPDGAQQDTMTYPDDTQTTVTTGSDLTCHVQVTHGTAIDSQSNPDPRFGMQLPTLKSGTVTLPATALQPGTLSSTASLQRTAVLGDPGNPLSLSEQTDVWIDPIHPHNYVQQYITGTGRRIVTTSREGRQKTEYLDPQGRQTEVAFQGLHPVRREYLSDGRLRYIKHGPKNPDTVEARVTTLTYKATNDAQNGLLDSVTDASGRSVSVVYDAAGRITSGTLPDGRVIGFGYDDNGNVTSITPPGRPAHEFQYTPLDEEELYTPPQIVPPLTSTATHYTYNDDNQLTQITRPDGGTIINTYDGTTGQLITKTLPTGQGQLGYTYHPATAASGAGMLQSITAPSGGIVSFAYKGSLLQQEAWEEALFSGSVERQYNNVFLLGAETVNQANPVVFGYDEDGLMTSAGAMSIQRHPQHGLISGTTLGGVSDTVTLSPFAETEHYTATTGSTTLLDIDYERDELGRITRKTETIQGNTTNTHYKYDPAGHLYRVCADHACTTIRSEYHYDANGNRIACEPAPNQTACTFTATHGALLSADYDDQDRLLNYKGTTYTYTANGELETKTVGSDVTRYTYDALGNLRRVVLHEAAGNEQTIDYVIDGQNRRIGKKVDGVLVQGFLYENQLRIVAELDASGNVISRFVYGEKVNVPEYMVKGGVTYRIITDHLGSPRLVLNATTGAVAQEITYDEFGNVTTDTNPGWQPFGFGGGLYDQQTKLTRFGARDYDAEVGRWTAKDPIGFAGKDLGLYSYSAEDPINRFDPDGTQAISAYGIAAYVLNSIYLLAVTIEAGSAAEAAGQAACAYRLKSGETALIPVVFGLVVTAQFERGECILGLVVARRSAGGA